MKNRTAGILVIGTAILIGLIIFLFNRAMTKIVSVACSHGPSCPMWGTLNLQTNISIAIMGFVALIGLYILFFVKDEKPEENKITKIEQIQVIKKKKFKIPENISNEEKKALNIIISSDGTIFQSDLVEKTEFTKVKMTRILDRLEGKGLIERKRRGMTNVVVLKH